MKKYVIAFLICIYTTILVPILISDIPDSVSTLLNITLIAAAVLGILCMIALFKSIKEILQTPKQQDELNNLALLLKIAVLPVYAYTTLIGIGAGTIMMIFPGMIFLLPLIYAIVTTLLCFLLVITSSYSIACIYVHYRNGIFSLKKTILHVILQVIFFIDVIDYIYLFFNIRKCRKELIDFA
ncbi:hypothetical protein [Dielma fastidiosa]|uniref:Uncharacterized protein n=1 Tax=Dielma fastidiosa TaxID=1034346 RepID=A0A318L3Q7_9FIRM|nr:hypothetical protein [Dielma fastidiosa]PXX75836.1 hypothetical protein DES51_11720 [Dielma fastidiosa]